MIKKYLISLFFNIELFKQKISGLVLKPKKGATFTGFSGKSSKSFITANETVELGSRNARDNSLIKEKAKVIIKEYNGDTNKILDYIRRNGTPVIKAKHADKILNLLKEDEGFIYPQKGMRALILSLAIKILSSHKMSVGFKTPEMFFMKPGNANFYFLAHQFYHWMAYKSGKDNFNQDEVYNFKNLVNQELNDEDIAKMSASQIFAMKDIISRDVEAIEFVKEITKELIGVRNAMKKLSEGKSINI